MPVSAHFTSSSGALTIITVPDEPPQAGEPTTIQLVLVDENEQPITQLDTVHERKMHVFVIGRDLQTFGHIHPEDMPPIFLTTQSQGFAYASQGIYQVPYTFPKAGFYIVFADYTTDGVTHGETAYFYATGNEQLSDPIDDFNRTKQVGAYTITLHAPTVVEANRTTPLDFELRKNGVPVRNVQQYLGSEIHVVTVQERKMENAAHTHAYIPGHATHIGNMTQRYTGPTIPVRTVFENPGVYAIFGQVMVDNELLTAQFMVQVEPRSDLPDASYEMIYQKVDRKQELKEVKVLGIVLFVVLAALIGFHQNKKHKGN